MAQGSLSISKLPRRTQMFIFALLVGGLSYIFYMHYIQPLAEELRQFKTRAETLSAEVQKGQIVQARLPEFKREVEQQRQKLARLRAILPEQKETAEIIRKIEELAVESNLKIKSFTPQRTVRKDFYEDWPILISLEGSYNNLGVFFEKVGQFTRIINVEDINIKGTEKGTPRRSIEAICKAITFVFLDDQEVEAEASQAASQSQKKQSPQKKTRG